MVVDDVQRDPSTDSVRLRRISPLFHAEKIKVPLMFLQGASDPRVLKVESDDIVAAAKKRMAWSSLTKARLCKRENEIKGYTDRTFLLPPWTGTSEVPGISWL